MEVLRKAYRYFWEDLTQNNEPYTEQFARIVTKHPAFWYGTIGTIVAFFLFGILFFGWLILHVKDYIKKG